MAVILRQTKLLPTPQQKPVPLQVFTVNPAMLRPARPERIAQPPAHVPLQIRATATPKSATASAIKPGKTIPAPAAKSKTPAAPPAPMPAPTALPVHTGPSSLAQAPASTLDVEQLLSTARNSGARRELSASELAALTAPPSMRDQTPVHTDVKRPQRKPGKDPASDVLEYLPDGSQLVRVGNKCVLASVGADLRKDIHSMKVVSCGAGGRSEQDRIDAHFEQVMSGIGKHR